MCRACKSIAHLITSFRPAQAMRVTSADINSICQQRLFRAATALQADEGVGVGFIGSGLLGLG